ncbi:MAG: pilus assembly PilX N-terminal domain-containing protein [Candidatus Daviesbacteria bacterium]|nr:pilus assembly PilX N-terminal domain-containing protein [Candidatus Daviesbacteria bacterium]
MNKVNASALNQKGQVLLILLLVMTVALAIGLSLVQRSATDISTSVKLEQSSRAFSAAEAGIEKALGGSGSTNFSLENNTTTAVTDSGLLPADNQALEYPPIGKEEIAHVWLADPNADFKVGSTGQYYSQTSLDVYWGLSQSALVNDGEKPALEVTLVYKESGTYKFKKFYFDPAVQRVAGNGFMSPDGNIFTCGAAVGKINTIFSKDPGTGSYSTLIRDRSFYCKAQLTGLTPTLILLRARIFYSNSSHPFAVAPLGNCSTDDLKPCSLPKQVKIILSKGTSGNAQRSVQLFKIDKVVPFFMDYAIFSAAAINK